MKTVALLKLLSLIIVFSLTMSSCGIYSLSGGSLSGIKTVSISTFSNQSSQVVPSLAEDITEKLKDNFVKEMKLTLVDYDGDISFEGSISDYRVAPASICGDQTAATTRLTISVKVKFENTKVPENSYDASFSNYIDFESTQNIADIETELHDELTDMLVQDIFNKAVNNW